MTKRFTGWHMTAILVAFFGIVVSVNVTMAVFASRTFGGVVVENSYVASQKFNGWLAAARAQERLSWKPEVTLDDARHVTIAVSGAGESTAAIGASATARHPLGRAPDIALEFVAAGQGRLRSVQPLPAGRWLVHTEVKRGAETVRLIENLQ